MVILTALMMPTIVTMIPTFVMWSELGLTNSLVPLTLPIWFGGGVYNIFLFRQFFMGIPKELDEAALIDGASFFTIYWRITLPLSKSVMVVVAIFSFLNSWNDFMGPLYFIQKREKDVILQEVYRNIGQFSTDWTSLFPMMVLGILPLLVFYIFMQKYIISGVMAGSVKG